MEKLVWIIMKFCSLVFCLVFLSSCSESIRIDPPVVDASWRASADDRLRPVEQEMAKFKDSDKENVNRHKKKVANLSLNNTKDDPLSKKKGSLTIVDSKKESPSKTLSRFVPIDAPVKLRTMSPAVIDLLEKAEEANRLGKEREAIVFLKKARQISPTEPEIFFQLSKIHLEQKRYENATMIAEQALNYSQADRPLMRDLYSIIARARNALNDKDGARLAKKMARELL